MTRYAKNTKLNKTLCAIEESLLNFRDSREESLTEIKRYIKEYPREIDYNIAQHGNLLVYYSDLRNFYAEIGWAVERYTDTALWDMYKGQVGYVARALAHSN